MFDPISLSSCTIDCNTLKWPTHQTATQKVNYFKRTFSFTGIETELTLLKTISPKKQYINIIVVAITTQVADKNTSFNENKYFFLQR